MLRTNRHGFVIAGTVAVLAALAACSTAPKGSPATTETSPSKSASPTAACEFAASRQQVSPGNGENIGLLNIELTNTGSGSCELSGYPAVRLLDGSGKPIDVGGINETQYVPDGTTVTVGPGGHAYFFAGLVGSGRGVPDCPASGAVSLGLTPPTSQRELVINVTDIGVCGGSEGRPSISRISPTPVTDID